MGILLILFPTVIFGGVSLLTLLVTPELVMRRTRCVKNLWRAGHAHAGVLLVLSLLTLRYVDEATLSEGSKTLVRHLIPTAAILLPVGFFLALLPPNATHPNGVIYAAYVGAFALVVSLITLGVGCYDAGLRLAGFSSATRQAGRRSRSRQTSC